MGKLLSLLIGAVVTFFGLIFLFAWGSEFAIVLKGTIPVILITGGVIAVMAGFSELKDVLKSKKEN